MTGNNYNILLQTLSYIGVFLLIGTILRAKVKLVQKLYLPACVVGGIIGLVLGPRMLGILPMSEDIVNAASNMPGKFFMILITGLPMCAAALNKDELLKRTDAITIGLSITFIGAAQFTLGFLINVVFNAMGYDLYAGYGTELFQGFCGGHGTAAGIG